MCLSRAEVATGALSLFESKNAWPVEVSAELECLYERVSKGVAQ